MDRKDGGSRFWMVVAAGVIGLGCGGNAGSDAGPGDSGAVQDAPVLADAPIDAGSDAGDVDGGPCGGCGAGQACLRGVCIASCGGDPAALDAALAAGLTPVAHVCRAGITALDVVDGAPPRVYEVTTATSGTVTTFTLVRWTIEAGIDMPTASVLATATHDVGAAGSLVFAGGYVAVSPDEMHVLFGYTTTDAGFVGGVFDAAVGSMTVAETAGPGNYDAAWLDGASWLVNGLGLGTAGGAAQGLYLHDGSGDRQVAAAMGDYSGSVAVLGGVVLAGGVPAAAWPDGTMGDRVFVLDRAALLGAGAGGVSAWTTAVSRLEVPSSFELLSGMRIASLTYDASFAVSGIEARALSLGVAGWTAAAPTALATGSTFSLVRGVGPTELLFVHAGGALLVQE